MASFNSSDFLPDPSDAIVNSNLAIAIILTILSSMLCGAVLLPVVVLKSLRLQPYQLLIGNYVSSSLGILLGSGLYRMVQIVRYKLISYEEASGRTECGVLNFHNFALVASNYCLFVVGWERFIYLQFKKNIDWITLLVFISFPWALGILGSSIFLADSSKRYENIPYLGMCVDTTDERDTRRIIRIAIDIAIPVVLAIVSLSLASYKAYSRYAVLKMQLYSVNNECGIKDELLKEKKSLMKIFRELSIPATLLCLRVCVMIVTMSLFREYGSEGNPQDKNDVVATIGISLLLLEVSISPVVFAILNIDLRQAVLHFIRRRYESPGRDNTEREVEDSAEPRLQGCNVTDVAVGVTITETSM